MATTRAVLACPPCETGPFTRNHYFTGKLLVERDFTDEQRYYVDKLRNHHQRLHGWGVVCGLKVKPHPSPACRDRFVCIEPGMAVDCCGREVVVAEEECIELEQFEEVRALLAGAGDENRTHTLQVTLCYRECPIEEIPVLYDECGCDDAQCAPNRILESFRFGVRVDPPEPEPEEPGGVALAQTHTLAVARAHRVAVASATGRVYVLAADDAAGSASLLAFSADTHALLHTASFAATDEVMDLAVAADGSLVFVSLRSTAPGETRPLLVRVLDGALAPVQHLTLPDNAAGVTLPLAASADGRLYALHTGNRRVYAWADPGTDGAADRIEVVTAPAGARLLRVSPDGAWLFLAGPSDPSVTVVDTGAETSSTLALPAGTRPAALASAGAAGEERLLVAGEDGRLRVFGIRPGEASPFPQLGAGAELGAAPVALAASAGGRWVYALVRSGAFGRVQAVDAHRVESNDPHPLGASLTLDERAPRALALSEDGTRLYAAGAGDPAAGDEGGVAVIEVTQARCEDVLLRTLEGCPECDDECLVLATVRGWTPGAAVEEDDIDNWAGRRVLPSVSDLAEVVRCLLEQGGGGGVPGDPGAPGLGIDAVKADFVECTDPGSAQIQTVGGVRTLVLEIPRGCDGEDGDDGKDGVGLEQGLTRIDALSWVHRARHANLVRILRPGGSPLHDPRSDNLELWGIVISFTREVRVNEPGRPLAQLFQPDLDPRPLVDADHVFQVLVPQGTGQQRAGLRCRCPLAGDVLPVEPTLTSGGTISEARVRMDSAGILADTAPAVAWVLDQRLTPLQTFFDLAALDLWVKLRGDFVVDVDGRAVDAEFVRAQLPTGDRPSGSDRGVQGGLFESWCRMELFQAEVQTGFIKNLNQTPTTSDPSQEG